MRFFRDVFSDPDGKFSLSRVLTTISIFFSFGWVSFIVWHEHKLPELTGLTLWNVSLYGISHAAAIGREFVATKLPSP